MFSGMIEMLSNANVQFLLVGYLVGGIPFGLLLAKIFAKTNIKESGSKSIGATNVLRVLKAENPSLAKKLAASTVLLDAFKAVAVMALANALGYDASVQWGIGVLGVLGHCFSPYLNFEGGKGVATGVGVLAWFLPLEVCIALLAWFILAKTLKISSVSSLGALGVFVASSYIFHPNIPHIDTHAPIFIIAFLVVYKHIPNIIRLLKGEEKSIR